MKVLITGATGFIGQHLVKRLVQENHQVSALVRNPAKARQLFGKKMVVFQADVTDKKSLAKLPQDFDWLFHLAAAVSYRYPQKQDFYQTNVLGSENVFWLASKMKRLQKIVYLSSVGVYGPIQDPPADETWLYQPETDYEISKEKGEQMASKYIKKGLAINIIQPTLVYGPGDTASGMMSLFRAINKGFFMPVGQAQVLMHPAYIDNLIDGLILAAQSKVKAEVFIIADEKSVSLKKLAAMIGQTMGVKLLPFYLPCSLAKLIGIFGDLINKLGIGFPLSSSVVDFMTHHRAYNIAKAKKLLGYQPRISLKEGIKRTVDWYKKEGFLL